VLNVSLASFRTACSRVLSRITVKILEKKSSNLASDFEFDSQYQMSNYQSFSSFFSILQDGAGRWIGVIWRRQSVIFCRLTCHSDRWLTGLRDVTFTLFAL